MGWREQASVNPKAETVEELQERRKNLHLGMCKLLREDLALKAEQQLADRKADADTRGIRDRVVAEFDELKVKHESEHPNVFNADEKYKELMVEAIDGKAYALLKMDVYLESAEAAADRTALDRIRDARLQEFADPAVVPQLRTGITQFPWAAVITHKSPEIDLGDWNAAGLPPQARDLIVDALGGNANIRVVAVKGVKLALSEGWRTAQLEWASNAAVEALPATVALVLCNCRGLTSLDIRPPLPPPSEGEDVRD